MRAPYAIRVAAISLEALLLFASILGWLAFESELMGLAKAVALNDELLKYLLVLPLGLGAWIFNEARMLLQEDKETTRVLTAWPDYWRLKTHIWIALHRAMDLQGRDLHGRRPAGILDRHPRSVRGRR